MKIISLLIVLLIVGWMLYGQLELISPPPEAVSDNNDTPLLPTTPQQLETFDNEINQFVIDSAAERARQIEQNQ